jgi:hypothetical protein
MGWAYSMRALLEVRRLAGLRQPYANSPVHEDDEQHDVTQQEDDDKASGDRVSHNLSPNNSVWSKPVSKPQTTH